MALYATRDGHLYIRVAFRELHSEKNIQMIAFRKLYKLCLETYREVHRIIFISFLHKKVVVFFKDIQGDTRQDDLKTSGKMC